MNGPTSNENNENQEQSFIAAIFESNTSTNFSTQFQRVNPYQMLVLAEFLKMQAKMMIADEIKKQLQPQITVPKPNIVTSLRK